MSTKRQYKVSGFTLVETMAAVAILLLVLVTAMNSLMYVVRMERINSVQNELDIQVRTTMERLRQDLRLSSMDYIFVYPQGSPTNSAISFPKARDDDGDGLIELDADGKIIWDITLVYHVWQATPNELRLTTFDPRDNTLTDAQRQAQLESVVLNGNGYSTFNGQNARTRALFRNLFTWNVRGRGAQFDLYSPAVVRMRNVAIGTALLAPGNHTFKFTVVGKNALSTGYKIGLDQLVVSPCGVEREAEDQLATATYSGAVPTKEYMSQGAWGANYQLAFPATGPGDSFTLTMENDRWEETNFKGVGALCEDTTVFFDESLSPADFVVALPGHTNAWTASAQTLDLNAKNTSGGALRGSAVRVMVRGGATYDGGAIENSGPFHCAWFYASTFGKLKINGAFISKAANATNYSPDAVDNGIQLQFYYSGGGSAGNTIEIPPGDYARAELPAGATMYIDKAESYIISYLVDPDSGKADARYWTEAHPPNSNGVPWGCYIIPASANPGLAETRAAVWSSNTNIIRSANLYGLTHVHLLAPPVGRFTSQIVDTGQPAPQYTEILWNAVKQSGSDLKMRVRTGNQPDMSDAPDWTNVTAMSSPGAISPGNKRYVQFQAELFSGSGGWNIAKLKDATIRWNGITRLTDISGTFTMGPEYGIMEVTVDNKPLVRAMTIDLTIYKDVPGFGGRGSNRLTSTLTTEVEPRNTGK